MRYTTKNAPREPVGDAQVRPYQHESPFVNHFSYHSVQEHIPFKVGDVIWVEVAPGDIRRAKIIQAFADTKLDKVRFISTYKVVLETKDGYWSRQWVKTWPGYIYRAYRAKGLV